MSPRLLRPVSGIHPEAMDWRTRVIANGGTVDGATMSAVSQFCRRIDGSGLRGRFYRLNLFCGNSIEAALVPLYRAESRTASARGNTTDTNTGAGPFVSGDYNNTGASSGLTGNGSSKFLNTGINANSLAANNAHMAAGVAAAATGTVALRVVMGAFNNASNALLLYGLDIGGGPDQDRRTAYFSRFPTLTDGCGPLVNNAALGPGNVIAAYPTLYVNGTATGTDATTSQDYPSAHSMYVFALNNSNSSVLGYFNGRINWYSIGLSMTASQAATFNSAVAAFNTALSRT